MLRILAVADAAESSAVWLGFAGTTLTALTAISVAVVQTWRRAGKTEAMTLEIHHLVNSRAAAQDARIAQLAAQLEAAGIIPDVPPSPDIALAGGTMTVVGSAVTERGETVAITGEAVIAPADDEDRPSV